MRTGNLETDDLGRPLCEECKKPFRVHRESPFGKDVHTCGSPECQRKRKTRLQREKRSLRRHHMVPYPGMPQARKVKQHRSTLPHTRDVDAHQVKRLPKRRLKTVRRKNGRVASQSEE